MPLTAEEQLELEALEKKEQSFLNQSVQPISQAEEQELFNLEDKEKTYALGVVEDTIADVFSQAAKPFKWGVESYEKARTEGREMVSRGIGKNRSPLGRVMDIGLGTLQYVMAPLTAVAEPFGKALAEATASPWLGSVHPAQKEVAEFVGKLGEEAVYFIPFGGTIKQMMMKGEPGLKAAEETAKITNMLKSKTKPIKPAEPSIQDIIQSAQPPKLKTAGPLKAITEPQVKQTIINDITKAATGALEGRLDESRRIFSQIADALYIGEINPNGILEVLPKFNLSPEQFAKMYMETVSQGGRILGYHGRAAKELQFAFRKHPEATAILDMALKKEIKEPYAIDKVMEMYSRVENFRRAMLVGQVATAVRNAWSQTGRIALGAFDDALQGAVRGSVGGQGKTFEQMMEGLNTAVAVSNRFSKKGREKLLNVLESQQASIQKLRLFSQPVHEVQMGGKIAHFTNTLNRGQEFFFRRIGFEAKLRSLLDRKGLDFNTINPKNISEKDIAEAANYALEMTFASSPKSPAGVEFLKAWNKIPFMTLINPFPRFNFFNAIPFVFEHSPLGYLNALKPSTLKELASGNPEVFAKAASRATLGSMGLSSAMSLRQSKYAGEKWYQIKTGTDPNTGKSKYIDTRAFAPFSTYLFLAEAIANPKNITPADWAQAVVGLNRIAGTGLVVMDWIRAQSGESLEKQMKNFVGQYAASFFTPARSLSDFYQTVNKEEGISRDTKQSPFIAPLLANLPHYSQMLPERPSLFTTERSYRGDPIKIFGKEMPAGVFRQMTGLSQRTKTVVQKEVDSLNVKYSSLYPTTGNPRANRLMVKYMAPLIEKAGPRLIKNYMYKRLSNEGKKIALSQLFSEAKEEASKQLARSHPSISLDLSIKRLGGDVRKLFINKE